MHLLVEQPDAMHDLVAAPQEAQQVVGRCPICGNMAEGERCGICEDTRRDGTSLCVVEHVPDLIALERSSAWRGRVTSCMASFHPFTGSAPSR